LLQAEVLRPNRSAARAVVRRDASHGAGGRDL